MFRSFINSFAATVYIALVAIFMFNIEDLLGQSGKPDTFLAPLAMLLLFVLSASVVSGLILGKPILLYLNGAKSEGIKMFIQSLLWLFVFAVLVFAFILFW